MIVSKPVNCFGPHLKAQWCDVWTLALFYLYSAMKGVAVPL